MKIKNRNFLMAIFGMALAGSTIGSALGTAKSIFIAIGFGLMLVGIFVEIGSLREEKAHK